MKTRIFAFSIFILIVLIENGWLTLFMDDGLGFKWFKPFNDFLEKNTQGLIVVLLISLFGELVRSDELKGYLRLQNERVSGFYTKLLEDTPNRALVELALKREYPEADEKSISGLVSNVIAPTGRIPFFNCVVAVELEVNDQQPTFIQQHYTLEFSANIEDFIVANAKSPLVSESLFASLPSLTEVIILEKGEENIELVNFQVEVNFNEKSGATATEVLEFQRLKEEQILRLGRLPVSLLSTDYSIFSARIPGKPNSRRTITVRSKRDIQVGRHRYIWMSERPIFMKTITIDATKFPEPEMWDFSLHPFLAKIIDAPEAEKKSQYYKFDVYNWVVMGQGVCLTWQKRDDVTTHEVLPFNQTDV